MYTFIQRDSDLCLYLYPVDIVVNEREVDDEILLWIVDPIDGTKNIYVGIECLCFVGSQQLGFAAGMVIVEEARATLPILKDEKVDTKSRDLIVTCSEESEEYKETIVCNT